MSDALQQPFGGEIWEQRGFPCFSIYVVTGPDGMSMSTDPRQRGNCLHEPSVSPDSKRPGWWKQDALAKHLHGLRYVCVGQLYDLILGPKHLKEIEEIGRVDTGRGNRWRRKH